MNVKLSLVKRSSSSSFRRASVHTSQLLQCSLMQSDEHDATWIEMRQVQEEDSRDTTLINRRTRLKLDLILLPFLSLLFCLNSLDKTNIGNAETAGFSHDTGLAPEDVNVAMACFFAFFVALQPAGAALGRRIGMARWVPGCMSLWGLCTILHIWVSSRWQLIVLRILIATLEAGFYPTTVSYLSLFYTRYEFAVRLGFFYGQAALSGALGGVLSWALFSRYSNKPWQVLFLVEGSLTFVVALIGFVWLPHSASQAWFFNKEERVWAEQRISIDRQHSTVYAVESSEQIQSSEEGQHLLGSVIKYDSSLTADAGLQRSDIVSAFLSWKIYYLLVCNILSAISATAFSIFLPVVIENLSLDLSPATTNLLAVPPFALGAATLLVFAYWSDRTNSRLLPILTGLLVLATGLSVVLITRVTGAQYAGLCVLLAGSYVASPLTVSWISDNTPSPGKRSIALGINGWGNIAGASSAFLFLPGEAATGYAFSFFVTLSCTMISFLGYCIFFVLLRRENSARLALLEKWSEEDKQRESLHGDVRVNSIKSRISARSGLGHSRRGDERITYRYTF